MNTILKTLYQTEAAPLLQKELGLKSALAVPRITKVVVSVGLSQSLKDPKVLDTVEQTLTRITGQKPVKTKAKQSISSFKIRQGMVVGMMVTMRGDRMWDFLTKLVHVTLPRIRDFRGLSRKSVDGRGNLSIGFRENLAFPEIRPDEVERLHGLEVTISTTAGNVDVGRRLFEVLGFPLAKA
jgi:large subunit ribosomal protein L5